jgi:hypothetical protein
VGTSVKVCFTVAKQSRELLLDLKRRTGIPYSQIIDTAVREKYADLLKDSLTEYYKSAGKEGSEIISDFTGETAQVWPE